VDPNSTKTALKNLQPGVTEFVIHLAFADDEMKAATRDRDTWGAAWRQRDFDFFTARNFATCFRSRTSSSSPGGNWPAPPGSESCRHSTFLRMSFRAILFLKAFVRMECRHVGST